MFEVILEDLENQFPGRSFLSVQDVCQYLGCDETVVYNWNKRQNLARRPVALTIGKHLKFQKKLFAQWLSKEQSRTHAEKETAHP